jgi:hypothetical protein
LYEKAKQYRALLFKEDNGLGIIIDLIPPYAVYEKVFEFQIDAMDSLLVDKIEKQIG